METLNSCKQWNIPLSNKGETGEGLVMKFENLRSDTDINDPYHF